MTTDTDGLLVDDPVQTVVHLHGVDRPLRSPLPAWEIAASLADAAAANELAPIPAVITDAPVLDHDPQPVVPLRDVTTTNEPAA